MILHIVIQKNSSAQELFKTRLPRGCITSRPDHLESCVTPGLGLLGLSHHSLESLQA